MVKKPLANEGDVTDKGSVQSLGQEDPLEEGMATHSSILAWRIPMDRKAWWVIVHRVSKNQIQLKQISIHSTRKFN